MLKVFQSKNTYVASSVQFSSVAQSRLTLCDPMNHSTPGLPVHHQLLESTKPMSIESVMPYNHLILCHTISETQSFPASGSFSMSQLFASGGQNIGVSASTSVLPMNIQNWFPLGWTVSPCSPRDSQESSPTPTVQKHQFFSAQLSL